MTPPLRIARYEIQKDFGDGGFGSVYLARDPGVNRRVAVRLLRADLTSPARRENFHLEARAAAALQHRNIAAMYDFGEFEGHAYLVLEYVEGRTLASVAATPGPRPIARTLLWLEQLCAGLDWAHRAGVLHRNIKPANLVVDDVDRLKILDFGVAAMAAGRPTRGSEATGTVGYLPPEYLQGAAADHRTDIFSVGAVAYLMLTRREPFPGETAKTVTQRVVACEPAPPRDPATGRDLDRQLADIVMRALHRSSDRRYQDAQELQRAFSDVRERVEREAGTASAASAAPRTVRPVDSDAVKRRRDEMIVVALERARSDLAAGRLEQAMAACVEAATLDEHRSETIELTERVRRALDLRDAGAPPAGAKSSESARPRPLDTAEMEALFARTPPPAARDVQGTDQPRRPATAAARELQQQLDAAETAVSDGDWPRALAAVENAIRLDPMHPRAYELQTEIEEARGKPPAPKTGGEPARSTSTRAPAAPAPQTTPPPVPPSRDTAARAAPPVSIAASPHPVAPAPPAPVPSPAVTARPATERPATARPATARPATERPATSPPREPATAPVRATPPPAARRETPAPLAAAAAAAVPKSPIRAKKPAKQAGSAFRRLAVIGGAVAVLAGVVFFFVWRPPPAPPQTVTEVLKPDRPIEAPPPPPPAPPPVADPEPAGTAAPIATEPVTSSRGPTTKVTGRGDQRVPTTTTVGGGRATPPEPGPPPPPPLPSAPPSAPPQRVARARSLLEAGSVREAVDSAGELRREFPEDKEVLGLLDQAQGALRAAIRQALDAAASSENAGNWPAALQHFERAQQLDPAVGGLDPAIARVKARMTEAGNAAFVNARQFDALDRVADAIKWYEVTTRNLLDGDPKKRVAVERLAALRALK